MIKKAYPNNKKELKQQFHDAIFAQLDPASVDITNERLLATVEAASKMLAKSVKKHLKEKKDVATAPVKPKRPVPFTETLVKPESPIPQVIPNPIKKAIVKREPQEKTAVVRRKK